MLLREYNLGYTPRELLFRMEWWEVIGLLYASNEYIRDANEAHAEARKKAEIERKEKDGSLKMHFRRKRGK